MSRTMIFVLVLAAFTLPLTAQAPEPDLVVSALTDTHCWGVSSGKIAYSFGSTVCNVGTTNMAWDPATNAHALITHNLYRLKDGRFQQIGMSWVRHPGSASNQPGCGPCVAQGPAGTLNVACADTTDANSNGTQAMLGPRGEVNVGSGGFPFPVAGSYPAPASVIDRRLQALPVDLEPLYNPGAQYFVEAQVVHPDDASSGMSFNNASFRAVTIVPGTFPYELAFTGPTQMKPAIQAWQDADPTVQLATVDVPGDGRFIVGFRIRTGSGMKGFTFEYLIQNISSDRGLGSLSIETFGGSYGLSWSAPPQHSGEPYSNAQWTASQVAPTVFPGSATWATTPYATNPNANALRWGSSHGFSINSSQLPGRVTLGLFKPGAGPATITIPAFAPTRRIVDEFELSTRVPWPSDYVDISTTGLPGPIGDDNAFAVPVGFPFPFYGQSYSQLVISTNGYLTLPGQDGTLSANTALPDPGGPNGMIAGYWDDLDCSNLLDIRYQTVSTAAVPLGFAVYWNCRHLGDTQPLRFELLLKPDGSISSTTLACPETQYGGGTATRGIESPDNTSAELFSFNTFGSARIGESVLYARGWPSANLFLQGRLSGGFVSLIYVSSPSAPILTVIGTSYTKLDLGPLGILPSNPYLGSGISDYFGILTGYGDATAITDSVTGIHQVTAWVPPGLFPSTSTFIVFGVDFPSSPTYPGTPNGWFNISNAGELVY